MNVASFFHLEFLWMLLSSNLVSNGECRLLSFPAFFFFADKRLVNHILRTEHALNVDICELLCYQEHNCVSFNFKGTSCDLNNSTHREHNRDFENATGNFYHGTDNVCGSSPCPNGATCQSGFTNKRYRCLCPAGSEGEHCEQDECDDAVQCCLPSHAYVLSYRNALGSFNYSCNHGYVGDGKTNCTAAPECFNFTSLTEHDRKPSFPVNKTSIKNDKNLGPGWFRFQGDAGRMMTTSCTPKETCNTAATGWLNGSHPEVIEGIVTRKVCFSYNECCQWHTIIQVRNCGDFFVYFFSKPDSHSTNGAGSLRYCGSD